jgi:hypothetical protein
MYVKEQLMEVFKKKEKEEKYKIIRVEESQ